MVSEILIFPKESIIFYIYPLSRCWFSSDVMVPVYVPI